MLRPNDCIYCSNPAGSAEHIFPAALGGRRKNKSILCGPCNEGFSDLDGHVARQLQDLRGLLGVRPDHKDAPVPAAILDNGKAILIDAEGRPSYKDPVTLADEPLHNGNRRVITAFSNERQAAAWRAEQRRKGFTITDVSMKRVGRVMTEPVKVEWQFGGSETFREAARIALNFLAHRFPTVARDGGLRPLKEYVQGKRALAPGGARPVWFHGGEVKVPASTVELGHQVFLRLDREIGRGYAIVSFFAAVELLVDFGPIAPAETTAVIFDIDPHADHPPSDLVERSLAAEDFPASVEMLKVGDEQNARLGDPNRFARILGAISERQSRQRLAPLVAELGRIRELDRTEWSDAIGEVLRDHEGSIYRLIEQVAGSFATRFAAQPDMQPYAVGLAALAEPDPEHPSGLTPMSRVAVQLARVELADAIAAELAAGPVSLDRITLLVEGGPGAAVVAQTLLSRIGAIIDRTQVHPHPPMPIRT